MGNIVNIIHGIYQSINDSASHRFGIQWTGDIASDEHSLAREAETLVRASDNCTLMSTLIAAGMSEIRIRNFICAGSSLAYFRPYFALTARIM